MNQHFLEAATRPQRGRKTNVLRAEGSVPAVVYGVGTEPRSIAVDHNQFIKTYQAAGESSVVELKIDNKDPLHVLIQDFELDPIRNEVIHIDFRSIDMNKEIEAEVDLEFVGDAPAVKSLGGTLITSRESVKIRCLPSKLMRSIQVDLGKFQTFDDVIRVGDLPVPDGVTILEAPNLSIAVVAPPRSEEEMKALDAAVEEDVSAVEVAKEKKEVEAEVEETSTDVKDTKKEEHTSHAKAS